MTGTDSPAQERKVAIVTGAAGGFGRVFVRALLDAGMHVAAIDIDQSALDGIGDGVGNAPSGRVLKLAVDIGSWEACEAAVGEVAQKLGPPQVLINNAAMGMSAISPDHFSRPVTIDAISPEMWQRFTAVNFCAAWNLTKATVGGMRARSWGRIISVTTNFRTMLRDGFHPYGPAKAGLEAMSAGHAKEFAGTGVTVNVVVPGGPSDTPMVPAESGFERKTLIPPGAMVPPVLWLCSSEADGESGGRYIASKWDAALPPREAAKACRIPIGWPDLSP